MEAGIQLKPEWFDALADAAEEASKQFDDEHKHLAAKLLLGLCNQASTIAEMLGNGSFHLTCNMGVALPSEEERKSPEWVAQMLKVHSEESDTP